VDLGRSPPALRASRRIMRACAVATRRRADPAGRAVTRGGGAGEAERRPRRRRRRQNVALRDASRGAAGRDREPGRGAAAAGQRAADLPVRELRGGDALGPDQDALLCDHCGTARQVPRGEARSSSAAWRRSGGGARARPRGARRALRDVLRPGVVRRPVDLQRVRVLRLAERPRAGGEPQRAAAESLVPLDVGRAAAEQSFRRWLKGLWFRPSDLKRTKNFEAAGRVRALLDLRLPRALRLVGRRRPLLLGHRDVHDHGERPAHAAHPPGAQGALGAGVGEARRRLRRPARARLGRQSASSWRASAPSIRRARALQARLPRGWHAEEYQVDLDQGWAQGLLAIEEQQRSRCSSDVPGTRSATCRSGTPSRTCAGSTSCCRCGASPTATRASPMRCSCTGRPAGWRARPRCRGPRSSPWRARWLLVLLIGALVASVSQG
jgi:hypothetical protein